MKFKQMFEQLKLYQNTLASHKYSHQWKENLFSFPIKLIEMPTSIS